MKIQVKQLKPNPYRDIENYPINEQKISTLMDSIERTGFWDNILARENEGEVELAYGHHRREALMRTDPEMVIDIPVKELDDVTMLRIMANENMEQWSASVAVVDETIRATYNFLESQRDGENQKDILAKDVADFLGGGWNLSKVSESMKRMRLVDMGVIDRSVVESLESPKKAEEFVRQVVKPVRASKDGKRGGSKNTYEVKMDKKQQRKLAEELKKESIPASYAKTLANEIKAPKKGRPKKAREETFTLNAGLDQMYSEVRAMSKKVETFFSLVGSGAEVDLTKAANLMGALDRLHEQIEKLQTKVYEN